MAETPGVAGETLDAVLRRTRGALAAAGIADASLDARLIVEHATSTDRMDVIRDPGRPVSRDEALAIEALLARRLAGEPVHRILGHRDFYGLTLGLSPDTLEPRPDTETLVDLVLPRLRRAAAEGRPCRILDLGTGTGAIALAVLVQIPQAHAVAADIAPGAVETARRNALTNGLSERFETVVSDWFGHVSGCFDAILSNPPYITDTEYAALAREVKDHDPVRALVAGADGLDAYRAIAAGAAQHLRPGGIVGLEIGASQKRAVTALFETEGYVLLDAASDLGGRDRALVFGR
ncbi:peptide chain release factor N(5)-glutamine methyltransferase [Aquibium carbonis]|uniref:Release factor glutamine methyltransferase n=1 Tax=Aquibium carbonis TaxID=2495581 RepID=A0A429YVT7_9HYPH|nr:peptide chain release factor N(5)-glutamine methyltransferase [Aquibium carbonis]RST85549.1 peptide chain release factor N(5)-glutamine methyltransferase [Aquibium carbonis]